MSPTEPLAGYDPILDEIVAAVRSPDGGTVVDLRGTRGSGRSKLLGALEQRLGEESDCTVASVDVARHVGRGTDSEALGVALAEYENLLRRIARRLRATGFDDSVGDAGSGSIDENLATRRADDLSLALCDSLRDCLNGSRLVLLADNGSALTGPAVGWFGSLLGDLTDELDAVVVVARTADARPDPEWRVDTLRLEVPQLTRDEVARHLEDQLGAPAGADVVDLVMRWSGGHRLAVTAAGELAVTALEAGELQAALEDPPATVAAKLKPSLELWASAEEGVRSAIEVGAVLRGFDLEAVLAILARLGEPPPDDIEMVLRRLPVADQDDHGHWVFYDFFCDLLGQQLKDTRGAEANQSRFDEISAPAVNYYRDALAELAQDRGVVYAGLAERLEGTEGQRLLLAFLQHSATLTDRDIARFNFASVYFEVFWWWASYLESPLAVRLLDEWKRSQNHPGEAEFIEHLRSFQRSYVPVREELANEEGAFEGRWATALDALQQIRRIVPGIRDARVGGAVADDLAQRHLHVRAITTSFLGDAQWGRGQPAEAEAAYLEALREFAACSKDVWCTQWARYQLGDLALDEGKPEGAERWIRQGIEGALEAEEADRDYEVIANCHRVLADLLIDANPRAAFRQYLRAVFAAYAFHTSDTPDEYTRAFHREQTTRAMTRLRELADSSPDLALEVCREILEWQLVEQLGEPDLPALLAEQSWDALESILFPREPHVEELDLATGPYMVQARLVVQDLLPHLLKPLPGARTVRGLVDRAQDALDDAGGPAAAPEHSRALPDTAVPQERFESDHPAWTAWWRDELAPSEWQSVAVGEPLPSALEAALKEAIEQLPPRRREVLEARDVKGVDAATVFDQFGYSASDQTVMLHRARAAVRRSLEPHFARQEEA